MENLISQFLTLILSGGILLWFGKLLLEKSVQARLEIEANKINLIRHADLDFKKSQIQYLYGPLYGILKTNKKIYDLWIKGELEEINLKVKKLFKENNEKANKIIVENAHLIDESPMPECFAKYATRTLVWSMYCADTDDGVLPARIKDHPDIKWCQEFENYIFDTYARLSCELSELYKKYEIK